jgi:DNA-binding transcriptional LysR family regulator
MSNSLMTLDFRLLQIFDALSTHRSVSRAAEVLDVLQPAVSQGLRRLRTLFDDALFVRTPAGMAPTERAQQLREPIAAILAIAGDKILPMPSFDPAQSTREFRIIATDFGAVSLLPQLLPRLRATAPDVRIRLIPMDSSVFELLGSTAADLALGIITATRPGIRTQVVFKDVYACALRSQHPARRTKVTRATLRNAQHVVVSSRIGAGGALDERAFKALRGSRVALHVPSYAVLPAILSSTDFVAIVPRTAGRAFFSEQEIDVVDPPFKTPQITVVQAWHERNEGDLGVLWLRKLIKDIFAEFPA